MKKVVLTQILQRDVTLADPKEVIAPGDGWVLVSDGSQEFWTPDYSLTTPKISDHSKVKIVIEDGTSS